MRCAVRAWPVPTSSSFRRSYRTTSAPTGSGIRSGAALDDLGLDSLDLLLLHWPPAASAFDAVLDRLAEMHDAGYARAVGVSNFTAAMMKRARERLPVPVLTNQVEFHPLIDQSRLHAAAAGLDIRLSAYCALARGEAVRHPGVRAVARALGRTPAQTGSALDRAAGASWRSR